MQGAKENVNTTTITIDILRKIREDFLCPKNKHPLKKKLRDNSHTIKLVL